MLPLRSLLVERGYTCESSFLGSSVSSRGVRWSDDKADGADSRRARCPVGRLRRRRLDNGDDACTVAVDNRECDAPNANGARPPGELVVRLPAIGSRLASEDPPDDGRVGPLLHCLVSGPARARWLSRDPCVSGVGRGVRLRRSAIRHRVEGAHRGRTPNRKLWRAAPCLHSGAALSSRPRPS